LDRRICSIVHMCTPTQEQTLEVLDAQRAHRSTQVDAADEGPKRTRIPRDSTVTTYAPNKFNVDDAKIALCQPPSRSVPGDPLGPHSTSPNICSPRALRSWTSSSSSSLSSLPVSKPYTLAYSATRFSYSSPALLAWEQNKERRQRKIANSSSIVYAFFREELTRELRLAAQRGLVASQHDEPAAKSIAKAQ